MTYQVLGLAALTAKTTNPGSPLLAQVEQALNALEQDGWTLAHVHTDPDSEARYPEWFIFHKPTHPDV
jgi:hypothetical protein